MLIEANGIIYKLYFRRNTKVKKHTVESGPGYSVVLSRREITTSTILEEQRKDGSGATHEGKTVCGILDVFNKETGRVLALKQAMKDIPRETREIIWEKYHNRKDNSVIPQSLDSLLNDIEISIGIPKGTFLNHLTPKKINEKMD